MELLDQLEAENPEDQDLAPKVLFICSTGNQELREEPNRMPLTDHMALLCIG